MPRTLMTLFRSADGLVEASFRLTPERFAEGLGDWLTQRGKGRRPARESGSDASLARLRLRGIACFPVFRRERFFF